MTTIPIVASANDLPGAIRHAEREVSARWYVAKRAAVLGKPEVVPASWGITASFGGDWAPPAESSGLPKRQARGKMGRMNPITAAGWDPELHPRDRNGRFIEKGDIVQIFSMDGGTVPMMSGKVVGNRKGAGNTVMLEVEVDSPSGKKTIEMTPDRVESAPEAKATLDGTDKPDAAEAPIQAPEAVETPTKDRRDPSVVDRTVPMSPQESDARFAYRIMAREDGDDRSLREIDTEFYESEAGQRYKAGTHPLQKQDHTPVSVAGSNDRAVYDGKLYERNADGEWKTSTKNPTGPKDPEPEAAEALDRFGKTSLTETALQEAVDEPEVTLVGPGEDNPEPVDPDSVIGEDAPVGQWTEPGPQDREIEYEDGANAQVSQSELGGPNTWSAYYFADGETSEYAEKHDFASADEAQAWVDSAHGGGLPPGDHTGGASVPTDAPSRKEQEAFLVERGYGQDVLDELDDDELFRDFEAEGGTEPSGEDATLGDDPEGSLEDDPDYQADTAGSTDEAEIQAFLDRETEGRYASEFEDDDEFNELVARGEAEGLDRDAIADKIREWVNSPAGSSEDFDGSDVGSGSLRRDGGDVVLSQTALEDFAAFRDFLDVDRPEGSWASGLSSDQFDILAGHMEDWAEDPESVPSWANDKLTGLQEFADKYDLDPYDALVARRDAMQLGWSVSEQLTNILNGESLDEQNRNALERIGDYLQNNAISRDTFNLDDQDGALSLQELAGDIDEFLNGAYHPEESDGPDESAGTGEPGDPTAERDVAVQASKDDVRSAFEDSEVSSAFDAWADAVILEDPEGGDDTIRTFLSHAMERHQERVSTGGWSAQEFDQARDLGRSQIEKYGAGIGGKDNLEIEAVGDPREYDFGGFRVWAVTSAGRGGRGSFPTRDAAQAYIDGYNEEYDASFDEKGSMKPGGPVAQKSLAGMTDDAVRELEADPTWAEAAQAELVRRGAESAGGDGTGNAPESASDAPAGSEAPSAPANPEAGPKVRLMARSAEKESTPLTYAEADDRITGILNSGDPVAAQKDLAKLMTELKLGGKQRKRYRELLDEYFGSGGGDSASVSAAATADNLSDSNPVKERLKAKAAEKTTIPAGSIVTVGGKDYHRSGDGWETVKGTKLTMTDQQMDLAVKGGNAVVRPAEQSAPETPAVNKPNLEEERQRKEVEKAVEQIRQLDDAALDARIEQLAQSRDNSAKKYMNAPTGSPAKDESARAHKRMEKYYGDVLKEARAERDSRANKPTKPVTPRPISEAPDFVQEWLDREDERWAKDGSPNPFRNYEYYDMASSGGTYNGPETSREGYSGGFGVKKDPGWNTNVVEHGYYGSSQHFDNGEVMTLSLEPQPGGGYQGKAYRGLAKWVVEFGGDEANARRIWENRGVISKLVLDNGGQARLSVKFNDDGTMTVADYDYNKWSATVPVSAGKA